MKRLIWTAAIGLMAVAALPAQQGRGGAPLAWNDANKDGICDVTNQPVGQNPGQGRRMAMGQGQTVALGQAAAQGQAQGQVMGRGRGGAPFAWNDRDRDGICDVTGQAVGQRPIGFGRGRGMGVAITPGAWSRGGWSMAGRGRRGGGMWRQPQPGAQTQQAPAAPAQQTPPEVQEQ